MILTELLGQAVQDGDHRIGYVTDVRLILDETSTDQPTPPARLYGLIVSPGSRSSSLGYERSTVRSPWPIVRFVRWRQRGTFLVLWADIAELSAHRISVRPGFQRYAATLDRPAAGRSPAS